MQNIVNARDGLRKFLAEDRIKTLSMEAINERIQTKYENAVKNGSEYSYSELMKQAAQYEYDQILAMFLSQSEYVLYSITIRSIYAKIRTICRGCHPLT